MLKWFISLFAVFTISYWIGYFTHKISSDKRPVCFISFGIEVPDRLECFFGFYERPYCNVGNLLMEIPDNNGTIMYFLLSRDELIRRANGKQIYIVTNSAFHSMRNSELYMLGKFKGGNLSVFDPE